MSAPPQSALWLTVAPTADRLLEVGRRLAGGWEGDEGGEGGRPGGAPDDVVETAGLSVVVVEGVFELAGTGGGVRELLGDCVGLWVSGEGTVAAVVRMIVPAALALAAVVGPPGGSAAPQPTSTMATAATNPTRRS